MKEQVIRTAAALVLCAALPAKAGAAANRVPATGADGPRFVVPGTQKPASSAFKLARPARLVVDLAGADVTSAVAPAAVHKDGIAGVTVAQFDEGATKVGRIVVALESDSRYDVSAQGNDLVVVIGQPAAATEERASPATGGGRRPEHTAGPASHPNPGASREDVRDVSHPASRLHSVALKGDGETRTVVLATDGEAPSFDVAELRNPGRPASAPQSVSASPAHTH